MRDGPSGRIASVDISRTVIDFMQAKHAALPPTVTCACAWWRGRAWRGSAALTALAALWVRRLHLQGRLRT